MWSKTENTPVTQLNKESGRNIIQFPWWSLDSNDFFIKEPGKLTAPNGWTLHSIQHKCFPNECQKHILYVFMDSMYIRYCACLYFITVHAFAEANVCVVAKYLYVEFSCISKLPWRDNKIIQLSWFFRELFLFSEKITWTQRDHQIIRITCTVKSYYILKLYNFRFLEILLHLSPWMAIILIN